MQFVIIARDGKDALDRRLAARSAHMDGIRRGKADGSIIDGGALLDAEGRMVGSVILCEFADRAALDAYLATEPYERDSVWENVEILEFRRVDWTKLMATPTE